MKQKELSVWLRIVVIVIGAAVLFLAVVFLPDIGQKAAQLNPELAYLYWPCLIFIWCTVLPMLAALALAWQIFTEIGRDNSFCLQNAQRLRKISVLALLDTLLYIGGFVALALLDAMRPGALVGTICIVFLGLIMTVISAALSHLTRKAADLKAENAELHETETQKPETPDAAPVQPEKPPSASRGKTGALSRSRHCWRGCSCGCSTGWLFSITALRGWAWIVK